MMSGKEKIYFLLNRIDDARAITPKGEPVKIHATHDLNNNYRGLLRVSMRKNEMSIGQNKMR